VLTSSIAINLWSTRTDGGGVRGLSALIILREMMKRIQYQQQLDETPLPCDYFDLIGGTGTGGCVITALISCSFSLTQILFSES
jgi:patatin-like phospholipase/acyl hydrolase